MNIKVEAKAIIGNDDLGIVADGSGYYTGATKWNINPRILFWVVSVFHLPILNVPSTKISRWRYV